MVQKDFQLYYILNEIKHIIINYLIKIISKITIKLVKQYKYPFTIPNKVANTI